MTNNDIISLSAAAQYYRGYQHQQEAFDYLTGLLTQQELQQFADIYRKPIAESKPLTRIVLPVVMQSQRDYGKGDLDKDGKADWAQTCNVHSVSAVVNFYRAAGFTTPQKIDQWIRSNKGSRYSHSSLASALAANGILSTFSTATSTKAIIASLLAGNPVIWSNRLTHGGHIVVLAGVDTEAKYFVVADPYGEPSRNSAGKWVYADKRGNYKLSFKSFQQASMNGPNSSGHWAHLLSKA
jgi:hypothetical protein